MTPSLGPFDFPVCKANQSLVTYAILGHVESFGSEAWTRQIVRSCIWRRTRRPARAGGAAEERSRPRRRLTKDSGCPVLVGARGPAGNRRWGGPDRAVSRSEAGATTGASGRDRWNAVAAPVRAPGGVELPCAGWDLRFCRRAGAAAPGGAAGEKPPGLTANRNSRGKYLPVAGRPLSLGARPGARKLRGRLRYDCTGAGNPPGLPSEETAVCTPPQEHIARVAVAAARGP
ncbi:hypothetical protein NDU88_004921 [Pleurodeles waltl]|uniref:Uncharacterized protein n=1 Tax=Pleurodeles waltl TaxID=8319 RepID=A0AAV7TAS0_PLEWA|nr:hypothetical protein NDU88_004921 [Pleurodeles waltl]